MSTLLEQELDSLIVSFEDGSLSFNDFSQEFSDKYIERAEELPDSPKTRMFDSIHERLEWTTEAPPDEDRAYGWGNPLDFREWLASIRSSA
ncbi:MAG: hypothetical protein ABI779_13830 [Acidobacteriota bacterium]